MDDVDIRAWRGAQYFDTEGPSRWFERVDQRTLNMFLTTKCIRGQLYDSYLMAIHESPLLPEQEVFYGLAASRPSEYPPLTKAWVGEVAVRKARILLENYGCTITDVGPRAVNVEGDVRTHNRSIIVRCPFGTTTTEAGRIATDINNKVFGLSRFLMEIEIPKT